MHRTTLWNCSSLLISAGCGTALALLAARTTIAAEATGLEFFEKKVRPVLAEYCHECHSHKAEKLKAQLYLDSRSGMLRGGESGVAVVPLDPDKSRLIEAIRYTDPDLQMPPRKKLPDAAIADLVEWVKMGAPWPEESAPRLTKANPKDAAIDPQTDWNERRKHWAYQPVRSVAIPAVQNPAWCVSEMDSFLLAKLEANGLTPAPPADRRTLIRRATYDLIGLPPTPQEVEEFLRDTASDAFAKVVDRLLASPHYGERWARHWLDLVRFSETLGFEFDFDLYNVWRYRDYVIRAFNVDLPYDQFVVEHLAGDLIPEPRRDPLERFNESIIATGFFWMGEGRQTPVDIRQEQADVIDGQIDVLGKAFLGQTIACARCHDHKFDAISTQDYYALAGYLKSSRYQQAFIDSAERIEAKAQELAALRKKIRELAAAELANAWLQEAALTSRYLLAARKLLDAKHSTLTPASQPASSEVSQPRDAQGKIASEPVAKKVGVTSPSPAQQTTGNRLTKETALEFGLDEAQLNRWVQALQQDEVNSSHHPLYAWLQLAHSPEPADQFPQRREALLVTLREQEEKTLRAVAATQLYEDFRRPAYEGWFVSGAAFDAGPAQPGDILVGDRPDQPIARVVSAGAHSGLLSAKLQGKLRSQTFTIEKPFVHFLLGGQRARVSLIIDGYTLIMNPMYGGLTSTTTNERPVWRTMVVDRWIGHRAHIEIADSSIPMHRLNPPPSTGRVPENADDAYTVLEQIHFSDERTPPPLAPNRLNLQALEHAGCENSEALATAYQELIIQELKNWQSGRLAASRAGEDGAALLNWLLQNGLFDGAAGPIHEPGPSRREETHVNQNGNQRLLTSAATNQGADAPRTQPNSPPRDRSKQVNEAIKPLPAMLKQYRHLEASIPAPLRAPAIADGTGEDEFVFIRGNHKILGERVPRRPPEVLAFSEAFPSPPRQEKRRDAETSQETPLPASPRKRTDPDLTPKPSHSTAPASGSGRLELARQLVDPSNPLLARVMVNRIWKHHFGEGIVRTPDDFGRMGQPPTHPELLDYLAGEFVRRGWSIKKMHRSVMLTSAYQMSSRTEPAQTQRDPENRLLHHAPVRRLEAEAIRDAILAVSGRLDRTLHGPSVLPYLTPYMEGRGRPNSGPLDGEGRRSIYINARRNFPTPLLVAFDYPVDLNPKGHRAVSSVPDQALTLMNDPFVMQQAGRWAERVLAEPGKTLAQRVDALYQAALTRPASEPELREAQLFLEQQSRRHGCGLEDARSWTDLCHVLINVKEFIFIN